MPLIEFFRETSLRPEEINPNFSWLDSSTVTATG